MTADDPTTAAVKYCPQCQGEFQATLESCPDCGVALSDEKPPHPEPVEVFATVEFGLLPLVRSTLGDADIDFEEVERDLSRGIMGEIRRETAFLVAEPDAERARDLLSNVETGAGKIDPPY